MSFTILNNDPPIIHAHLIHYHHHTKPTMPTLLTSLLLLTFILVALALAVPHSSPVQRHDNDTDDKCSDPFDSVICSKLPFFSPIHPPPFPFPLPFPFPQTLKHPLELTTKRFNPHPPLRAPLLHFHTRRQLPSRRRWQGRRVVCYEHDDCEERGDENDVEGEGGDDAEKHAHENDID